MLSDNPVTLMFEGSSHEEGAAVLQLVEPGEAEIGTIKAVDAVRDGLNVMTGDRQVVGQPIGHHQEIGEMAAVVQLAMELDGPFLFTKAGPVEDTQAEIDGGGVEGKERIVETKLMTGSHRLGPVKKRIEERFKQGRRTALQGVGQSGAGHRRKAQVIETKTMGEQTTLDGSQRVFSGDLGIE